MPLLSFTAMSGAFYYQIFRRKNIRRQSACDRPPAPLNGKINYGKWIHVQDRHAYLAELYAEKPWKA